MASSKEISKDTVIKATMAKYKRMFREKTSDKRFLAEQIYPMAAYFKGMTVELMRKVDECGCIAEQVNGNGFTKMDTTPAYKELKDTVRTLSTCIDSLGKLCPEMKKELKSETDELLKFVASGGKSV